jgi:hypothetical protein
MTNTSSTSRSLPPDKRKIRTLERATVIDHRRSETNSWYASKVLWLRRQFLPYYFMTPPRWRVALRAMGDRNRMLPGFLSLGPVRSGTTLLADYIMQHPCVVLPLAKEIGVSTNPRWKKIKAQFPSLKDKERVERKYGMAVTGYCAPAVPNLMFPYFASAVAQDLKTVVILRNPVDRTFSHWRWDRALRSSLNGDPLWENAPDFPEVVQVEIDALQSKATSGFSVQSGANCGGYVQHSIYLPFLKTLFRFFDREEAIIIDSGEFFADPRAVAKKVYQFLGLPAYEPIEVPVRNAGPGGKMDPSTRRLLVEFFEPLNRELYDFVGKEFAWQ